MTIVYGVDTSKPVSVIDVRDAIVLCFVSAHAEILAELKRYDMNLDTEEFERIKILNVQQMIRGFFSDVGGDFEAPTKEAIEKVLEKLKAFAAHFRNQEVISKHHRELIELVEALP